MPHARTYKKKYTKKGKKSSNTTRALALRALKQSSSIKKQIEVLHSDNDYARVNLAANTVDTHLLIPGLHAPLTDTEYFYKTCSINTWQLSQQYATRVIIVQFPHHEIDTTALPAITDILQSQKTYSPYKKDSAYKFKILFDKVFDDKNLRADQQYNNSYNIKINSQVRMRYDSGTTKYWLRNGVWVYQFHDSNAAADTPALYKRLLYTDA